jgi:hypothetical protein
MPRWPYLVVGAVAGAAVGALAAGGFSRLGIASLGGAVAARGAGATVALLAAVALALLAPGWLRREAKYSRGPGSAVLSFMLRQPGFASGSEPIAFAPVMMSTLAGPRLAHPLSLIPAHESCLRVRRRLRRGWVVVQPGLYLPTISSAFDAAACLSGRTPAYNDGATVVYAPVPSR